MVPPAGRIKAGGLRLGHLHPRAPDRCCSKHPGDYTKTVLRGAIFDNEPQSMPFDFGRFEGMMLGLAVGDALGNSTEGVLHEQRYRNFGKIRDCLPNRHADGRRVGTPTDDTQLAFWTLEQLIHDDGLVPDRLALRFCREPIFGIGGTVW